MLTVLINGDIMICTLMAFNRFLNSAYFWIQSWNHIHFGLSNTCDLSVLYKYQAIFIHNPKSVCMLWHLQGGLEWLFHYWITILWLWIRFYTVCLFYKHHNCNEINIHTLLQVRINIHFNNKFSRSHDNLQWKHWIWNRHFK